MGGKREQTRAQMAQLLLRRQNMNIKKLLTLVGMLAILVAALPAGAAFAQGPSGQNPPLGLGRGDWGGPDNSLVAVAAKVLGMEQSALVAELNTGKTIADVAKAQGVALEKIVSTFVQPHVDWLNQAVEDGKITQAQADQYIATMKANITARLSAPFTPRGNGSGTGFVDANGDGVCDVGGQTPQSGQRGQGMRGAQGQGRGMGR
jgi:hypothetical protein